jgi:hypothetical protein
MNAQPQPQHRWLQKLLGEWTYEHETACEPGKPPEKLTGSERVRALGELWVLCEGSGNMPAGAGGGPAQMLMTLGYDPVKRRFVGTWVGSMMTHLWVYDGELDEAHRVLTLNSQGPSFVSEGKLAKYQDIIELLGDDHRTLTSRTLGEDGKWQQFMVVHYRRKK